MRVLVTRPRDQALRTGARLEALGHEAVIDPVLEIRPLPVPTLDASAVTAIIVTSANALAGLAAELRGLPLFAVGPATAAAARAIGCCRVVEGPGDGAGLAAVVAAAGVPKDGRLVHLAGEDVRPGLAETLGARGFSCERIVAYVAAPTGAPSPPVRRLLAEGLLDAVLFTSPRSARLWVEAAHGLTPTSAVIAGCLSTAVAAPLRGWGFSEVRVAVEPDETALMRCLATPGAG